jgi:glycosyltransferase involved in cell wall biosynthesis
VDLARLRLISRKVAQAIDTNGHDVVLVFACRYVQSPLVLQYLKTPTVYYCSEPFRFFYEPKLPRGRAGNVWRGLAFGLLAPLHHVLRAADRRSLAAASTVYTHSQYTRRHVLRIYGRDTHVCPLGVDSSRFTVLDGVEKRDVVLSVGAVTWRKGHDDAVRALSLLDERIRPSLRIVGNWCENREAGYLAGLAERVGVRVEISVGGVSDGELVRMYNEARVVLCLAHGEPFGLTPLEAMACGTPVVAVNEGGYVETVEDGRTGFLVSRNLRHVADRIRVLLQDNACRAAMGQAGVKETRERWSWQRAVSCLEAILKCMRGGNTSAV